MLSLFVRQTLVLSSVLMVPAIAPAQVVGDHSGDHGHWGRHQWGFFNISRRMQPPAHPDPWLPSEAYPPIAGAFDGPVSTPTPWLSPGTAGDCCLPVCDPCGGMLPGPESCLDAGSAVAPGTPRAIPIPSPVTPDAGPEYVPRNNKVPTPIETPDDPNWHPIPAVPKATPKAAPDAASPTELPADIPIPMPNDEARRPPQRRTSSRFTPVPSAARVWSLRMDPVTR